MTGNGSPNPTESLPAPAEIRVILADSQAIYRVGMRKVFAVEDDIRVVAQAETLANLYTALQRFPTDVVVLEGQLLAGTIDAVPELVKRAPDAKLIVQVVEADENTTVEHNSASSPPCPGPSRATIRHCRSHCRFHSLL